MDNFITIYLTCLAILTVIITGIGVRAFAKGRAPGARILGLLMASMAAWAGFYMIEILSPGLPGKILARKMLYLGMTLSPVFWLWFALRYTGIGMGKVGRKHIILLAIPGGIAFLLGLTNEAHHLIWKTLSLYDYQPAPLDIVYGAGFWIYTVLAYALILAGIAAYAAAYLRHGRLFRIKTGVVLAGVSLTVASNLFFLYFENGIHIDPTPLSFGLSAPLIALGFFRFGVTSLFPLAASLIVENLKDAIVVVNRKGEVTDINRAAASLLHMENPGDKIPALDILPSAGQLREIWDSPEARLNIEIPQGERNAWYEARVIPITQTGQNLVGRVVVFHDITREQTLLRAEKRRSQLLALLEEAGRHIAGTFDEKEILQRAVDLITQQFGYAETAISILTADHVLEIAAISGTEDFGYSIGYRQRFGKGIIGHTVAIEKTYIAGDVSKDPHYFSTAARFGSAICTPIFKQGDLYGALYVESVEPNAFGELDATTLETLATQISASLQRAALYAQTQSDLRTLTAIMEISKLAASSLDIQTISKSVTLKLRETFGYTHVSIYFLEEDYLHLAAQVGYSEGTQIEKIHISQGVAGKAIRARTVQFVEDANEEGVFLKADQNIVSEICAPLIKEDRALGILNVESRQQGSLTSADVILLSAIAGPLAIACDNARLHAELRRMATTDAVTGLSNRHILEQALNAEVERAERKGAPASLIVFDVDFFKEYNDTWGHPAGDARLKAIADIIKVNLRKYDVAARYGGDEFAVILSDCSQKNALAFAQRLSQSAQEGAPQPPKEGQGEPGHTLSMGIATFPQDAVTPNELLIAADHAALRAKQQGRNRIKLADDYETNSSDIYGYPTEL